MTDPVAMLAAALPADPDDHGPVGVPSDALRGVLSELMGYRRPPVNTGHGRPVTIAGPVLEVGPAEGGGG